VDILPARVPYTKFKNNSDMYDGVTVHSFLLNGRRGGGVRILC
jgi:hypothetical protein